mmetsp:Transcript_23149/g.71557  ORF Transcript_23149/g.71557 Transcript_23149/m.71557 type:complete len:269 (-) Transcript_23149:22-828(-)
MPQSASESGRGLGAGRRRPRGLPPADGHRHGPVPGRGRAAARQALLHHVAGRPLLRRRLRPHRGLRRRAERPRVARRLGQHENRRQLRADDQARPGRVESDGRQGAAGVVSVRRRPPRDGGRRDERLRGLEDARGVRRAGDRAVGLRRHPPGRHAPVGPRPRGRRPRGRRRRRRGRARVHHARGPRRRQRGPLAGSLRRGHGGRHLPRERDLLRGRLGERAHGRRRRARRVFALEEALGHPVRADRVGLGGRGVTTARVRRLTARFYL